MKPFQLSGKFGEKPIVVKLQMFLKKSEALDLPSGAETRQKQFDTGSA